MLILNFITVPDFQSIATFLGGGYALFLYHKGSKEKRRMFVVDIFHKLYSDDDIVKVLYAADKPGSLEDLQKKLDNKDERECNLERETDKTLRYLDFIGALLLSRDLKIKDLRPFKYELKAILENSIIRDYKDYLQRIGVNFDNLDYLIKKLIADA